MNGHKRSNFDAIRAKYIQYTHVLTQNFMKNSNSILFEVRSGHRKSVQVKLRSTWSNKDQIESIRFDTKFGREFQLKAIRGQFRSLRELSGQTRDKIFEKGSNRSSWLINMQYTVYYIHRVYILYSNRLNKLFLKMYVYRYLWKAIILNNFSLVTMNEYDLRWVQKR